MALGKKPKAARTSRIFSWFFRTFLPIQRKKIVFFQFSGNGYGCHLKAIANEFIKRGLDKEFDLVWILKRGTRLTEAGLPPGIRGLINNGTNSLKELSTAKVWVNNIHFNVFIDKGLKKRKGTTYINTFHGGITIKRQVTDKNTYNPNKPISRKTQMYRQDSEFVDYIISACDTEAPVLKEFFYGHGEILKLGDARNDVLINGSDEAVKKVRDTFNIEDDTRIILYAPTFRPRLKLHWYDLDYEKLIERLESMSGSSWVMLIRLHPRLVEVSAQIIPDSPKFIDASSYLDVQELSLASDMLISDYSSVATDYLLTRKPAFLYVPDLDRYVKRRGLYFSMDEMPFPYATTTDMLLKEIERFDQEQYSKRCDEFLQRINYLDDGKSAERIVDFIIDICKG